MPRTNSCRKGKRGERELARHLRSLGFDCRRGQQHAGGPDAPDVVGIPGIHIESKYGNAAIRFGTLMLAKARQQACNESADDEEPVLFWKPPREPWRMDVRIGDLGWVTIVCESGQRAWLEENRK